MVIGMSIVAITASKELYLYPNSGVRCSRSQLASNSCMRRVNTPATTPANGFARTYAIDSTPNPPKNIPAVRVRCASSLPKLRRHQKCALRGHHLSCTHDQYGELRNLRTLRPVESRQHPVRLRARTQVPRCHICLTPPWRHRHAAKWCFQGQRLDGSRFRAGGCSCWEISFGRNQKSAVVRDCKRRCFRPVLSPNRGWEHGTRLPGWQRAWEEVVGLDRGRIGEERLCLNGWKRMVSVGIGDDEWAWLYLEG